MLFLLYKDGTTKKRKGDKLIMSYVIEKVDMETWQPDDDEFYMDAIKKELEDAETRQWPDGKPYVSDGIKNVREKEKREGRFNLYACEKNARKLEEIFHQAGLKDVSVGYCVEPFPYDLEGERIAGTDDVEAMGKLKLSVGKGNRVVIEEVQNGAALIRTWWYDVYTFWHGGVQMLVEAAGERGLSVVRVPWKVESITEAREFCRQYRFFNHSIGAGREYRLKKLPYYKIA